MKTKQTILHVIIPLFLGGLIYISFRSTNLKMFGWFETIGLESFVGFIRAYSQPLKGNIPTWIYYSLPDGLWVYSFSASFLILWGKENKNVKLWLLIPLFFGSLVEIAQGLKIFPGTFDWIDLTFCFFALLLSIYNFNLKFYTNEKLH